MSPVPSSAQESEETPLPALVSDLLKKLSAFEDETLAKAEKSTRENRSTVSTFLQEEMNEASNRGQLEEALRIKQIAEDLEKPIAFSVATIDAEAANEGEGGKGKSSGASEFENWFAGTTWRINYSTLTFGDRQTREVSKYVNRFAEGQLTPGNWRGITKGTWKVFGDKTIRVKTEKGPELHLVFDSPERAYQYVVDTDGNPDFARPMPLYPYADDPAKD